MKMHREVMRLLVGLVLCALVASSPSIDAAPELPDRAWFHAHHRALSCRALTEADEAPRERARNDERRPVRDGWSLWFPTGRWSEASRESMMIAWLARHEPRFVACLAASKMDAATVLVRMGNGSGVTHLWVEPASRGAEEVERCLRRATVYVFPGPVVTAFQLTPSGIQFPCTLTSTTTEGAR